MGCEENKIKCFTDYPVICLSNKDNAVLKYIYIYIYIYIASFERLFLLLLLCLGFKSLINSNVAFVLMIHSNTVAEKRASSCAK